MRALAITCLISLVFCAAGVQAAEKRFMLREYIKRQWTNELLAYPFTAAKGTCVEGSLALTGPQGPVPAQLSQVQYWPGTTFVKAARLSFIAGLAPLSADTYIVHHGNKPALPNPNATDLKVTAGKDQVEITTKGFGARLLRGEKTYAAPVPSTDVPSPVMAMRLGDGRWFGGSTMYGPGKLKSYAAALTDSGPVFARVTIRYTYENGNTLDLILSIAAGDNTIHLETRVANDQPKDGFTLVLSRGLPQLIFQVQDEVRKDRDCFQHTSPRGYNNLDWVELPLNSYTAPKGQPAGLVTNLSPWEDWFGTFTQTRIRLKLENTTRELQIRSLDSGAWVEPREIEEIFSPSADPDPAKSQWVGWGQKLLPVIKEPNGEVSLRVNAAQGMRKWTVSDCRSMPGVASLFQWHDYMPEIAFPPETRPTIGIRLDEVKDYVLSWTGDAGKHPRLFVTKPELEAIWKRHDADPAMLEDLLRLGYGTARSVDEIKSQYMPNYTVDLALGAYLLSGYAPDVAQKTQILARLRQALNYELWGMQFGCAGAPAPILYDGVIDSPVVPATEHPVLSAQMAYYAYRLADPAVWSAERGYYSGNSNMTVTWEISRGITACAIPEHPMAKMWYRKAERIMEYFLTHMVGPAGEWPESMGGHGRTSLNMILAFAIASTNSGFHDYVNDPRVKRLVLYWAKMLTPRDPRPRGGTGATPNRRYFPAMGRDNHSAPGGTCGVMARVTRTSDPAYAAGLQWAWLEEGASREFGHIGGFSYVSCDKSLPAKIPAWTSEVFPYAGAMFRHGLGTPNEHQVLMYSGDHTHAFYTSHTGSYASIFAYGTPVAGSFTGGYEYAEGFLTCHVDLAHGLGTLAERSAVYGYTGTTQDAGMWSWPTGQTACFGVQGGLANVSSFSTLPRQDYAAVDVALHYPRRNTLSWKTNLPEWPPVPRAGKPPVDWRRQTLFLKDDDPAKANYLLIRDSIKGGQPTMWQLWTVSETLDTPEKVQDVAAVLANKPGYKVLPARELKGNRFTAIGQLGVDVEYYIASPSDTPRYTLRWGQEMWTWNTKLAEPEYQDLLHLQMTGDGVYYVAFFPRKRNTPAPVFSTLGDGMIIKVSGDFGTDYGFLSAPDATASGDGVNFTGTVASVQDRSTGLVLSLGAKGTVQYQSFGLASDFPASLRVRKKALSVELPASLQPPAFKPAQPFPGGTVTVTAPGEWTLANAQKGVELTKIAAGWAITMPSGMHAVQLISK
ncbi:MAG: hypothetical protein ACYC7E_10580 [Armatimonadota bacterium]